MPRDTSSRHQTVLARYLCEGVSHRKPCLTMRTTRHGTRYRSCAHQLEPLRLCAPPNSSTRICAGCCKPAFHPFMSSSAIEFPPSCFPAPKIVIKEEKKRALWISDFSYVGTPSCFPCSKTFAGFPIVQGKYPEPPPPPKQGGQMERRSACVVLWRQRETMNIILGSSQLHQPREAKLMRPRTTSLDMFCTAPIFQSF
ncbi:hypothetical protein LX36DRAFT_448779 [Colletotrichum falcatum]|nr:hypothetical protein LX36DRAFT_448779 [Colletotrichum falcatum]